MHFPPSDLLVPPIDWTQLEVREQGSPLIHSIKTYLSELRTECWSVDNGSEEETENIWSDEYHFAGFPAG